MRKLVTLSLLVLSVNAIISYSNHLLPAAGSQTIGNTLNTYDEVLQKNYKMMIESNLVRTDTLVGSCTPLETIPEEKGFYRAVTGFITKLSDTPLFRINPRIRAFHKH